MSAVPSFIDIMKEAAPFASVSALFVFVKSLVIESYRNPKSLLIGVAGGVPLASLTGLSAFDAGYGVYSSLLITSACALVYEHIIAAVINSGPAIGQALKDRILRLFNNTGVK